MSLPCPLSPAHHIKPSLFPFHFHNENREHCGYVSWTCLPSAPFHTHEHQHLTSSFLLVSVELAFLLQKVMPFPCTPESHYSLIPQQLEGASSPLSPIFSGACMHSATYELAHTYHCLKQILRTKPFPPCCPLVF